MEEHDETDTKDVKELSVVVDNIDDSRIPLQEITQTVTVKEPVKKNKWLPWLLSGLLLLALGGVGGVFAYKELTKKSSSDSAQAVAPGVPAATAKTAAQEIIAAMEANVQGKKVVAMGDDGYENAVDAHGNSLYTILDYQPNGYDFKTVPKVFYGITTQGSRAATDADYAMYKSYLENQGMKSKDFYGAEGLRVAPKITYYNDVVYCDIIEVMSLQSSTYEANVGCADVRSYEENAQDTEVLYKGFLSTHSATGTNDSITMGRVRPKASKTNDYTIASTYVVLVSSDTGGSYQVLSYKTPNSASWQYLLSYNISTDLDAPKCSAFSTLDAKRAFLGEKCYTGNGTKSTVTP